MNTFYVTFLHFNKIVVDGMQLFQLIEFRWNAEAIDVYLIVSVGATRDVESRRRPRPTSIDITGATRGTCENIPEMFIFKIGFIDKFAKENEWIVIVQCRLLIQKIKIYTSSYFAQYIKI